jgi:hypothetical protein
MDMENRDTSVLTFGAIVSLFGVLVSLMYFNDKPASVVTTNICKEDSLINLVNELRMDLKMQSDGFDSFIEFYPIKKISADKTNKII